MILGIRNNKPTISFGLGETNLEVTTAKLIDIWLDQTYNKDAYIISMEGITLGDGMTITKVNDNHWTATSSETGDWILNVFVTSTDKAIKKRSNKITLTIT